MNPREFADAFLQPYRVKGSEIIPQLCPYCQGGDNHDKYTSAMNIDDGAFNCKRGSCGKEVSFYQLCEDNGVKADRADRDIFPPRKTYQKPKTAMRPLASEAEKYLALRKISKRTMDTYRVGSDDKGNIMFPFYENGELVFVKFRPARKLEKGERKAWRDPGTKPVLFGMDLCDPKFPLTITEGEADCLSCHEAGIPNSVSVPSGAEDFTWIDTCWEFLQQFEKIYLFGDNDAAGRKMIDTLARRLSAFRIFVVEHEYKDANELLYRKGPEAVKAAYDSAKELPVEGVLRLADVTPLDFSHEDKTLSGLKGLDKKIMGFLPGELSVWTGKRGEGKSTLLGQLMPEAVDQGRPVCVYSGEMKAATFQHWINLQAAGPEFIQSKTDRQSGKDYYFIEKAVGDKIKAWYADLFYICDNRIVGADEVESVLRRSEYCAKRYGCKIFMIDNLMTLRASAATDRDFYRQQSNIVGELVSFAKRMNVHVHLVAHPRKGDKELDNDSVAGSADVTNRCDNTFVLAQTTEKERAKYNDANVKLTITKNRAYGAYGSVGLCYCLMSRRLYMPSVGNVRKYGWENAELPEGWTQTNENTPFDMSALDMPF